ncbi:ATP-dependent zinc protease [Candidatus Saccharibacteria bacterium]|nr:ATP-dependent zinc protease [Candidatus Saccharibacteria bacterium]
MNKSDKQNLPVIGPSAIISVDDIDGVPAKIDTGAGASAIWASNITIGQDGVLSFCLFGKSSPLYTGKVYKRTDYKVIAVRSAMGQEEIRYRVHFSVKIAGRKIRVLFSLADRSRNSFPILIGKRTLSGKFLVDVSLPDVEYEIKPKQKIDLKSFKENPHEFHQKYVKKGES